MLLLLDVSRFCFCYFVYYYYINPLLRIGHLLIVSAVGQAFAESQDYGVHGERVRKACWGYLCRGGAVELREVSSFYVVVFVIKEWRYKSPR